VARRLQNWDVTLIASDPYVSPDHARTVNVTLVELPTVLATADVVSMHAVLTDETRVMLGEKEFHAMKRTAIFVNTARGELIDEDALANAVEGGVIAAAGVDAFTREPLPPDHRLRAVDPARMLLTPHNIAHSERGRVANLNLALSQILAVGRGHPPAHAVNPAAIPHWRRL